MMCGRAPNNELGMSARITSTVTVFRSFLSRICLALGCASLGGVSWSGATDESVNYSARPVLGEVVLGGRASRDFR